MSNGRVELTRRQWLIASALAVALPARPAWALETIRQGFQTNIWGMPTYYLLKSGLLEKHGLKFEEFAVPSGNLTMQQMVARQVDLGTYAAQSFIIGHDKGGIVVIAQIEQVGRTAQVVTRNDLNLSQVSELKGRKVANQTGSSVGNIFTDVIAPAAGLGTSIMDYSKDDKMPVFMAATPDFVDKNPDTVIAYLKCWQEAARDFKDNPGKVADVIYAFSMSRETFAKALAKVEVDPSFPSDLVPGLQKDAEVLLREKKISAIPDWKKALRPDLWAKARG